MKVVLLSLLLLTATVLFVPAAEAGPNCFAVYRHWEVGPVDVYQYSSCRYDVCVNDECGLLR